MKSERDGKDSKPCHLHKKIPTAAQNNIFPGYFLAQTASSEVRRPLQNCLTISQEWGQEKRRKC